MKHTFQRLLAIGLITVPASVFAADYIAADGNGDGLLSLDELQTVLPEVTTDMFIAIDTDGDGLINADELTVAQTEGLLPATDS